MKVYLIGILDLPRGVTIQDANQMSDAVFARLCADDGYVNTIEAFASDVLNGRVEVPFNDQERDATVAWRIL